ncbi:MAG TPA: WD40 repeat domain-containing protein [Bauldia sp.]|nr:WD40 repeat domain-containing protein [Bauldia sp.]
MNRALLPFVALLLATPAALAGTAAPPPPPAVTVTLPVGHAATPDIMTYSPDGRFLLTGDYVHQIKLWDVATGELIRTYAGHTDAITALTFSQDGAYFASASDDTTVRIWNVATGKNVNTLTEHTTSVGALAFSPDGMLLASGDDDGAIIVQDFSGDATGERRATVGFPVAGLKIDPANAVLVAVSQSAINTLDLATLETIKTFGPSGTTVAPVFVANSTRVLIPTYDGAIALWDYKKAGLVQSFAMTPKRNAWAFAFPDGKHFLTGALADDDDSGATIVWNGQTGTEEKRVDFGDDVEALAPDGKTVALGARGGIWIEDAETGSVIRSFGNRALVGAFDSMTADGEFVLTTYPQRDSMILWNLDTGASVRTFDGGGVAAISPDGAHIVGAEDRKATGYVNVWDADSGEVIAHFNVGAGTIRAVAFSADGKRAVIRVGDTLRTLDMTALDTVVTGPKLDEGVTTFALSPDGKLYATANRDGVVNVAALNAADSALAAKPGAQTFTGLADYASLAFSPDGKTLLGADEKGNVVLWTVKTGKAAKTFKTGTTNTAAGFLPDGASMFVAGRDGGLRLWNLKTGKALPPFMHDVDPDLVRLSDKGKTLTTVLNNGTVWRWSMKTGALLTTTARLDDGAVVAMTPEGFLDGEGDFAGDVRLVRNLDVFPLGDAQGQLVRPEIVAAKLAGDEAQVKAALKKLDLNAALNGASPADGSAEAKPTHVVIARVKLHEKAGAASAEGDELTPGTQVAVLETEGTWALVARGGQPIGFVPSDTIAPLQ